MTRGEIRKNNFVMMLFLMMGMAGFAGTLLYLIAPSYNEREIIVGIGIFCVFYAFVFKAKSRRSRRLLMMGITIVYLGFVVWQADSISRGIRSIIGNVVDRANTYYRMNFAVEGITGTKGDVTLAFLVVFFVVTGVLAYGILCRYSKYIVGILFLTIFLAGFFLGKVPPIQWILPMVFCFLGVVAGSLSTWEAPEWIQTKAALSMIVTAGIVALLAAFVVQPVIESRYPQIQKANVKLRLYVNQELWPKLSRFDEWFSLNSSQQVLGGNLSRSDAFTYTGARALVVNVQEKPSKSLYLKEYGGRDYTGDSWEAAPVEELNQYARDNGWDFDNQADHEIWNLEFWGGQVVTVYQGNPSVQEMEIERISAPGQYMYYPYGAYMEEAIPMYGDGALEGSSASSWKFSYVPLEDYYPNRYPGRPLEGTNLNLLEQQYEAYVYTNYLDYPRDSLKRLEQQCQQSSALGGSLEEISEYIVNTLRESAVYNMNPGTIPRDEELTEYFLYERKEGYCVHFATAATLMFRMMGVPARYVAGYMATPGSFVQQEDGNWQSTVLDSRAHAWTEIYISGLGWVPVEATPGYGAGGTPTPAPEEEGETDQAEQEPEISETPVDTPEPVETKGEKRSDGVSREEGGSFEILQRLGGILLTIAIIVGGFLLWRTWQLGQRRRRFAHQDCSQAISYVFQYFYKALLYGGFSKEVDVTSQTFRDKVCSRYPALGIREIDHFMDLVLQATYGEGNLSKSDVQEARRFYERAQKEIYRKLGRVKGLLFRMWN